MSSRASALDYDVSSFDAPAQVIIGRVRGMRSEQDLASAVAWRHGRILATGEVAEVLAKAGPDADITEIPDGCILPGFIDSHVHLESTPSRRPFDGCDSKSEVLERISEELEKCQKGDWCVVKGSLADPGLMPTGAELDALAPESPVFVSSGFAGVGNRLALELAGINRSTVSPAGGFIGRHPDGTPTGQLGDLAMSLIDRVAPSPYADDMTMRIKRGAAELSAVGVTTAHQMVSYPETLQILQRLHASDDLPLRLGLIVMAYGRETSLESLLNLGIGVGFGDEWLRFQGVKFIFDGGYPEGAMRYPESLAYTQAGVFRTPPEVLRDMVLAAHKADLRCCIHANGDQAVDIALDALEAALLAFPTEDHRHRLEHVGNVPASAARIERMRRLGVVGVPNPPILFRKLEVLRRESAAALPVNIRSFLKEGALVGVGSDFPGIYPADPLKCVHELVTRKTSGSVNGTDDQKLTVWEALSLYTTGGAWLGFEERYKGILAPGYLADFVILSDDPLTVQSDAIDEINVLGSIVAGKTQYATPELISRTGA